MSAAETFTDFQSIIIFQLIEFVDWKKIHSN